MTYTVPECPLNVTESEGWGMFPGPSEPGTGCSLRIECINSPGDSNHPVFGDDSDAWQFVVDRALAGSVMHKCALIGVSDSERDEIGKHVGVLTLMLAMKLDTTVGETL